MGDCGRRSFSVIRLCTHLIEGDTVLVFTNPRVGGGYVGKTHTLRDDGK